MTSTEQMIPLTNIYKGGFFKNRHKLMWRAPIVCKAVADAIKFNSVIDVGCAIGDLVKGFQELGYFSRGLEGSKAAKDFLVVSEKFVDFHDLRKLFSVHKARRFGLATCFEVAEHIEPEYAEILVANLAFLSGQVLVSIAPPGQGGHYHVNCRDIDYWDKLFEKLSYIRNDKVCDSIIKAWTPYKSKPGIKAYYNNLHFYEAAV